MVSHSKSCAIKESKRVTSCYYKIVLNWHIFKKNTAKPTSFVLVTC